MRSTAETTLDPAIYPPLPRYLSPQVRSTAETQADPEIKAEGPAGDLLDDALALALGLTLGLTLP